MGSNRRPILTIVGRSVRRDPNTSLLRWLTDYLSRSMLFDRWPFVFSDVFLFCGHWRVICNDPVRDWRSLPHRFYRSCFYHGWMTGIKRSLFYDRWPILLSVPYLPIVGRSKSNDDASVKILGRLLLTNPLLRIVPRCVLAAPLWPLFPDNNPIIPFCAIPFFMTVGRSESSYLLF